MSNLNDPEQTADVPPEPTPVTTPIAFRTVNIRQVKNGYVINCQSYQTNDAFQGIGGSVNTETIASDVKTAGAIAIKFLDKGEF